jgi:hypothetical protein
MNKFRCAVLPLLIVSLDFLVYPSSSIANEVYGPEINYRNCSQLQKYVNNNDPKNRVVRGFEKAELKSTMLVENQYAVYCNGGIIVNSSKKTVCYGYIAYTYSHLSGSAHYYVGWGQINGSPNFNDTGKERYCRRLK